MTLTAISPEQFTNKAFQRSTGYSFAIQTHILPVVVAELTHLVTAAMPLGFVQTGDTFQLVMITSLQPNTNLYVFSDGRWLGSYIPAILRGYPFRLAKLQDREDSVLCIEDDCGLVVQPGKGEPFFDDTGAPSQAVKEILDFWDHVERSRQVTQAAVEALQSARLIQPWPINLQKAGKAAVSVEGLFRIDEAALNELPDEDFLKLRQTSALPVAYAQLFSMNLDVLEKLKQIHLQLNAQAESQVVAPTELERASRWNYRL